MSTTRNTEHDIEKISQVMDKLAKLILAKQNDGTQLRLEYEYKLKELNTLISLLLNLSKNINDNPLGNQGEFQLNETELDKILRNGIEVIEKDDHKKYALIPIIENNKNLGDYTNKEIEVGSIEKQSSPASSSSGPLLGKEISSNQTSSNKTDKKKKKKKNKIACSFCHEIGHTRAKCQKRLLTPLT
ncbi:uncharacterized protein NDAI_0A03770 [Naumovozyma dairenensis CBS 421]|uniref:CCHC-type domain-containing protein n=1 Tax=Naumovozyma dairenensis (strain ATCC 10597 / BCRC 20456 / CBS 421 / NBRC 0211 / NRRL Y-12639) TaxID=1071378 RepID=G0W3Z6_NAUDC|nr:hypothetical protein NDAI_0A03770 [Naumovozyma dairenensis CBS 421]CCD22534.1 hypothetical protein NDAI_0A03770 [Naumovozyma dairenensis CBS 421]